MGPDVKASADDARRRSDEAVRRLRDESARRVDGERRRRSFSSWCALATLAGGISLAAMNAQEARLQEQEALRAAAERDARIANVCAERSARIIVLTSDMLGKLARAKTDEEREHIRAEAVAQKTLAIQAAAAKGCGSSATTQSAWTPEPTEARPKPPLKFRGDCWGEPGLDGL